MRLDISSVHHFGAVGVPIIEEVCSDDQFSAIN